MDIAFDEPTGSAEEGFGFDAASGSGVTTGMGFGDSSVGLGLGLGDDLGIGGLTDTFGNSGLTSEPEPVVFDPPAAQSYSPPAPVAAAPAPASSIFAAPEAENPLTIWEAQHKLHLKEKAEKEKINNDHMRKDADAWLKQFSDERKKNHDLKHKDNVPSDDYSLSMRNRANETAFKSDVEKIYTTGPTWTRVNSLVDLQQKTDRKDVGRMKSVRTAKPILQSVLTQVKESPPAHMSK